MSKQKTERPFSRSTGFDCYAVLDLFSGIGGFSLGLEMTGGFHTVAFCEIEPFARLVLRKHWPDVPIFEDVRELHAADLPSQPDVIVGGYPCQPFSLAGKRQGAADDRHLWPEMFRLVQECRPTWVVCENVSGHVSMGLDDVLFDLESAGYSTQAFVVPACAVDATHRRDRVWVIAYSGSEQYKGRGAAEWGETSEKLFTADTDSHTRGKGRAEPARQQWEAGPTNGGDDVADTNGAGLEKREGEPGDDGAQQPAAFGACQWPTEPGVCRVAHGIPNRVDRLRGLGNAVVPQVVEMIGRCILAAV